MNPTTLSDLPAQRSRVVWVDYAKGICIIMVVMMHSTFDFVQAVGTEGWLSPLVVFARPFRLPDFFLLSGLFLSLSINSSLRSFLDRKFVHFLYFYFIWMVIELGFTEPGLLLQDPAGFLAAFAFAWIEPVNTLWFVHMLAIFFLVTRLVRRFPPMLILLLAAGLHTAFIIGWIDTQWSVPNRFFERYVYFFAGYALAPRIFAIAREIPMHPRMALVGLALWAVINAQFTSTGTDNLPIISLVLGFAGAIAIVAAGTLLATQRWTPWLRYCGANSIVIYLSFFLPMKVGIKFFSNIDPWLDVGTICLLITAAAVSLPLLFHWLIKDTRASFLYRRPLAIRLPGVTRKPASLKDSFSNRIEDNNLLQEGGNNEGVGSRTLPK